MSVPQHMVAMKRANDIRMARSRVRTVVAMDTSRDEGVHAILDPAPCCQTLVVVDLLRWVPFIGTFKAMKICARARVGEGRRLGELTDRERNALVDALRAA